MKKIIKESIILKSGKYLIKDTTVEERKKLVNGAIAVQMTDGSAPSAETMKLFQKYIDGEMEAPKVVAQGADLIALKKKEVARENDVPIMENKPLARMLYDKVELDQEVPQEMYQAVAEILAFVYKLNQKKH